MKTFLQNYLLLFCCVFSLTASAQISGNLKDADSNEALGFANVVLRNAADSSMVKAVLSEDNGNYKFENIESGTYLLEVIMLSYDNSFSESFEYEKDGSYVKDFLVGVAATDLGTVEVVAKVPFLEQKAGMLVVNVENSITGVSGSMKDVLKKVPGVMVRNNSISLAGSSGVRIMIDGKPTDYLDINALLSEMSADDIARIEVSSQPGATMDAAGTGGVINIILKKNKLKGTNGSVTAGVGYGDLWKYKTALNLNHRQGAYNIYGSAGFSHQTYWDELDITRVVVDEQFAQTNYEPSNPYTGRFKLGVDYDINENHTVGVAGRYIRSMSDVTEESLTDRIVGGTTYNLVSKNEIDSEWAYFSGDLYYNIDLDTSGQQIKFSGNYSSFDRLATSTIGTATNEMIAYVDRRNDEDGITNIMAAKVDYVLPLSKAFTLKSGLKYSFADIDNDFKAYNSNNGQFEIDESISNRYLYDEAIQAAYAQGEFTQKKYTVRLGLRYENSVANGKSLNSNAPDRKLEISKLFPSAGLTVPITKQLAANLAYSYRVKRPRYSSLNPFIYNYDPYTSEKGNTFLNPEFTHSSKFSLTFEGQPFFNIEHDETQDVIMFVTEQVDSTRATFATTVNFDSYKRTGGSLFFPLSFAKGLDGFGGFMIHQHHYKSDFLDAVYEKKKWQFISFVEVSYAFPKDFTAEISGYYLNGGLEGIMEFESIYGVDFGVQKKFLDNRLICSLNLSEGIFKYWNARIDYSNMNIGLISRWETAIVNLEMTYKFGNRYLKAKKRASRAAAEEDRRIDKN